MKLNEYSEINQSRIVEALEEATDLEGYKAWLARGRQVRKGSKGIRILAPSGSREKTDTAAARKFFREISIFDITMTDQIV